MIILPLNSSTTLKKEIINKKIKKTMIITTTKEHKINIKVEAKAELLLKRTIKEEMQN